MFTPLLHRTVVTPQGGWARKRYSRRDRAHETCRRRRRWRRWCLWCERGRAPRRTRARHKGLGWLVRRDVHSEDTICITNLWHIDVHVPRPEIFGENMEHFDLGGISMPVGKLCLECPRSSNRIISRTVWPNNLKLHWSTHGRELAFHQHRGLAMGDQN